MVTGHRRARVSRLSAVLCAGALALCRPGSAGSQPASVVPAVVQHAVATYAASVKGVIGMQRHFSTTINGGVVHHSEVSESGLLMHDGAYAGIKYYHIVEDGKTFSEKQLTDRNAQTNDSWSKGKVFFKEPYDPRFVGDYRFVPTPTCPCRAGLTSVAFSSDIKDAQHGNGTLWIDDASGHVERLIYAPYVLPPHATSGNVTETSSSALPDLWYVTRIDEVYQGQMLMFKGSATFVGTFDHFTRFGTLAEGESALASGMGGGSEGKKASMSRAFVKELEDKDLPEQPIRTRTGSRTITAKGLATLKARLAKATDDKERALLQDELDNSIVGEPPKDRKTVGFGAHVTVAGAAENDRTFSIVGEFEMDVASGKITENSPLGKALFGARVGDRVVWHRPVGDATLTVKAIAYD
jgi:transcription elongation factor GreB